MDLRLFSLGVLTFLAGDSRMRSLGVVILGVAPLGGVCTIGVLGTDLDLDVSGVLATSFFCFLVELFGAGGEMEVFLFAVLDGVDEDSGASTFLGEVVGWVEVLATSTSMSSSRGSTGASSSLADVDSESLPPKKKEHLK